MSNSSTTTSVSVGRRSGLGSRGDLLRQIAGVLTFAVVLWLNSLAGAGGLSGDSIGVIANRYSSAFLPADYVFGIWGLIYLGLFAFTVFQALPRQRTNPLLRRLGWLWPANGLLNIAWIVTFSFSRFGAAMIVMLILLSSLVAIHVRVGIEDDLGWRERAFIAAPFAIYLAWISVAFVANSFQYVTYLDLDVSLGNGPAWSAAMMLATTALAAFMAWRRRVWLYPIVVAWALAGIAVRFAETGMLVGTAWAMVIIGLGSLAISRRKGNRAWA